MFLSVCQTAKKFTEESFAQHIRSLITNKAHDPQYYNITPYLDSMGTTHMSILAEDGSAVSVTSSINHMSVYEGFSPGPPPANVTVGLKIDEWMMSSKKYFWMRRLKIVQRGQSTPFSL